MNGNWLRATVVGATTMASLLATTPAVCAQASASESRETTDGSPDPEWTLESGSKVSLFPAGDIFPVYVADPHRPANLISTRLTTAPGIPGTTRRRTGLSGGGRFGILRFDTAAHRSWQVSIEGGIDAMFDSRYSDQAIGWDGNYGLTITTASRGPWSSKVAILHVSAHVGDEYEDRMNRLRINYTREELAVGIGWSPAARRRVYAEVGRAYAMLNRSQAPWRLQAGTEVESSPALLGGHFAWYGATDVQSTQERNWRIDTAFEGGIVTRSGSRASRLLIQQSHGRPMASEFFANTETVLTFALRIDF